MKKWIASALVLVALCMSVRGEDMDNDVNVALALAKAKVNVLAPVVPETAKPEVKKNMADYAAARVKAVNEKKTLVVFVGHKNPVAEENLSDCVLLAVDKDFFGRGKDEEVLAGKYFGGELWIVPDVAMTDSGDVIRKKVNDYVVLLPGASPPAQVQTPTIIQGGCANGQCGVPTYRVPVNLGAPIYQGGCSNGQCGVPSSGRPMIIQGPVQGGCPGGNCPTRR